MKLKLWAWREAAGGSGRVPGLAAPAAVIPDAVLCSEMGVQFSPCGNLVAACVACPVSGVSGTSSDAWHTRRLKQGCLIVSCNAQMQRLFEQTPEPQGNTAASSSH